MSRPLRVLFLASELNPIAKVGGLGDVAGALPRALRDLGVDIRIALPHYSVVSSRKWKSQVVAQNIPVLGCRRPEKISVSRTHLPQGRLPVYLINHQRYLGSGGIYLENTAFVGSFKEIQRFLFFSKAALAMLPHLDWWPDLIHCQDWHLSAVPVLLAEHQAADARYRQIHTLLTIHNLANQGDWKASEILNFLCPATPTAYHRQGRKINLIATGIRQADAVNTVSETYAREIQTRRYGAGLDGLLRKRSKVHGIINGVDEAAFNPQTDRELAKRYTRKTVIAGKAANKEWLQRHLKLAPDPTAPLFGLVSRLTGQKGIDLILGLLPEVVEAGGQLTFLGVGDPKLERALTRAAKKYPRQVASVIRFDAPLAKQIYAGSDLFFMPSRFEPCGLGQMIAMRYGTLPIVRSTGGLKDTVTPYRGRRSATATGFVFDRISLPALRGAVRLALATYSQPTEWQLLVRNSMRFDSSWDRAAKTYLQLYKTILKK